MLKEAKREAPQPRPEVPEPRLVVLRVLITVTPPFFYQPMAWC